MSERPRLVNITMVRRHLTRFLRCAPPAPYSIRLFREGDERAFDEIWLAADTDGQAERGLFEREFGAKIEHIPERMFFAVDEGGEPAGTATAWFNDDWNGGRWGHVHWVAVKPEHQGRGLARALMSRVMEQLAALGHDRAYLVTQTVRLRAVGLYLSFGFEPFIKTPEDQFHWQEVREGLGGMAR